MSQNPYESSREESKVSASGVWPRRMLFGTVLLVVVLLLIGLLLPVRRTAREAGRRMSCSSNLRHLTIALLNYELHYHEFPPSYTVDASGNRLHSWRTLILPFIEQQSLYSKVVLTKPWNDPANDFVRNAMVSEFSCPSNKLSLGQTVYLTVVTNHSALQPVVSKSLKDITDSKENTLLLYEAGTSQAVHWMSPNDASLDMFLSVTPESKTAHYGGKHTSFVDGSVKFLPYTTSPDLLRAMVTIDGNEPTDLPTDSIEP